MLVHRFRTMFWSNKVMLKIIKLVRLYFNPIIRISFHNAKFVSRENIVSIF